MNKIPFKAVAVDVDGTFVNDQKTYDHARFDRVLSALKANHIHFIVASGRPMPRLKLDFAPFLERIDIVSDNGAILLQDNKIIATHYLTQQTGLKLLNFIQEYYPTVDICANTVDSGYYLQSASSNFKNMMNYVYPDGVMLPSFKDLPTSARIIKLVLGCPSELAAAIEDDFNHSYTEKIHCTTTGYKNIDVVPFGVNKAEGLKYFLRHFDLTPAQLIAFGDGLNDVEMLRLAKYSYAMANANSELFHIAKYRAPSNNNSGVLQVLEKYLAK